MYRQQLTSEQALQKLKQYCAYQERSHQEVKEKLYELGVWQKEHDAIIAELIEQDYLNEERFAIAFVGGKFRIKQWGRVKIRYQLKQRGVSEYCIKKAFKQIDEEEYLRILDKLAFEKFRSLHGEHYLVRRKKTLDYLLQKGYETDLANSSLAKLIA
jgi:regulatory protein